MSERIATLISNDGVISLILDSNSYVIDKSHPNYDKIKDALRGDDADLLAGLVDIPEILNEYMQGAAEVRDGEVLYDGKPVHNTLTERILHLMEEGFPFQGMLNFLNNLMQNPSYRAINELYDFLDHKGLPITESGEFLGYKGIRHDWKDKYSGTIDNSIGSVVSVDRNSVDDNREHQCSAGLHIGCLDYVRGYCTERVVIVKVNPKNVVSVPRDHNAQKVRVCEYEVMREYTGEIDRELPKPMYSSDGTEYEPPPPEDDDYRDYDDDDDWQCGFDDKWDDIWHDDWEDDEEEEEHPCDECENDCTDCEKRVYY